MLMRKPLEQVQANSLLERHILYVGEEQHPLQMMGSILNAYFDYLRFHDLPVLRNDEAMWYEEVKFAKTLNMYFPDEMRLEQSRIYPLYVQYYSTTRCGAVITKDHGEKILLVQDRRTGKHGLPKGKIKLKQSEQECALREVKEETGLDIAIQGGRMTFQISGQMSTYVFFEAKLQESNPQTEGLICEGEHYNHEVTKWSWISIAELQYKLKKEKRWMNRCTQKALSLYFEMRDKNKK